MRDGASKTFDDPVLACLPLSYAHAAISHYYTRKINKYGVTPFGVDWTCVPTQELRFVQLLKVCDFASSFTLNDLGCGYGALVAYLDRRHANCPVDYLGIDLSPAMLNQARRLWKRHPHARFTSGHTGLRKADYSVASGIFNVQMHLPIDLWELFIAETLRQLYRTSARGFSVNFMTASTSRQVRREGVYATEPDRWTKFIAREFDAATEVIDNYGMREVTLIVRRRPISSQPE